MFGRSEMPWYQKHYVNYLIREIFPSPAPVTGTPSMGEWSGGGGVIHDQGKFAFGRDEPARLSAGV